jgi:leader peptidase (prepilin peptidase)/N-methyltransferase
VIALPSTSPVAYLHLTGFTASLIGAICGAGFIYLLGKSFTRLLQRDAMGFGDVKYMALIGGITGWQGVVTTLLVGCVAGSLGGLAHMFYSGRSRLTLNDVGRDRTPLSQFAFWASGARVEGEQVRVRWGSGFLVRFATGDPYVPFGPFLSIGAFVAAFWPGFVPSLLARWHGV